MPPSILKMTIIASVLACDEILRMTFRELRPIYPRLTSTTTDSEKHAWAVSRRRARHDLASTALVCRAFAEHALDALWEVLEGIGPLLKILPSYREAARPLDILSHITTDEWTRLHSYARRVRELHLHPQWRSPEPINPSFWPFLANKCKYHVDEILFPRCLTALYLSRNTTAYTIPFLSPALQSIAISFGGSGPTENRNHFDMLLSTLQTTSSSLRELLVVEDYPCESFILDERHIQSLAGFARLQRFMSKANMTAAAWYQIGSLRSLQHLDIVTLAWGGIPDSYSLSLPEMQGLGLRGPLESLSAFLEQLESPNLHSVSFLVRAPTEAQSSQTPGSLGRFLDLAKQKLPPTLRKFAVDCKLTCDSERAQDETHVTLDPFLTLLTSFTELEELSVDLDLHKTPVYVSDEAIVMLSKALPMLSSLVLGYTPATFLTDTSRGRDVRPTINALIALAAHCPHLSRLHLADIDVDADPRTAVQSLDHQLVELEFTRFRTKTGGSDRVFDFAKMLDQLFPHLANVQTWDAEASGISYCPWSFWDVAKASLGFMQSMRRNDRRMAASES